jgi:hypothetical protein
MRASIIRLLFVGLVGADMVWWLSEGGWEPIGALLAGLIGLLSFRGESAASASPTERSVTVDPLVPDEVDGRSVAVLPFANRSDDPETDYFSEGVSDDIIAQLAKIPDLKVISRTWVTRLKEAGHDVWAWDGTGRWRRS